ncbi:MAG: hypothetical protein FWH55_08415 [Oscillospiraceae bacterium]|nr:hypothetical protein [Oscillospiraceae bacterium]
MMSASQIREKLNEGMADIEAGRVRSAKETFDRFKARRSDETFETL